MLPLLLAGQWKENASGSVHDRDAVQRLAAKSYPEIDEIARKWAAPAGPLLRLGDSWQLIASDFVWGRLGSSLTAEVLKRFAEIFEDVLGSKDPALDLAAEDRWMAAVYDKVHPYSKELRAGLVSSLVHIALLGEREGGMAATTAVTLVRDLLGGDKYSPADVWPSVAKWLPALAEACPDVFLDSVDRLLRAETGVRALFEEGHWGENAVTHLLWALERVAWLPDYLTRIALQLASLAENDPGGKMDNRPDRSLAEILSPCHPQTVASVQHRCDCISRIFADHEGVAWKLGMSLLPNSTPWVWGTAKPEWRDWVPDEEMKITWGDYWHVVSHVVRCMLGAVQRSPDRWPSMIPRIGDVQTRHPELGASIVRALEQAVSGGSFSPQSKHAVHSALREVTVLHREHPTTAWALTEEQVGLLEDLQQKLQPEDPVLRSAWLFSDHPSVPGLRMTEFEQYEMGLAERRRLAVEEVLQEKGIEGVWSLGEMADFPGTVGRALAELPAAASIESEVLVNLSAEQPLAARGGTKRLMVSLSYTAKRFNLFGEPWLASVVDDRRIEWSPRGTANLLMALPAETRTWNKVAAAGSEVESAYWANVAVAFLSDFERDGRLAVEALLRAGRPLRALDVAYNWLHHTKHRKLMPEDGGPAPDLVQSVLEAAAQNPAGSRELAGGLAMLGHKVGALFRWLDSASLDLSQLAQLEWIWLPVLQSDERGPLALVGQVLSEPGLFVDLLKMVYRPRGEMKEEPTSDGGARARMARDLLDRIGSVPGSCPRVRLGGLGRSRGPRPEIDKTVDGAALAAWTRQVRQLAAASGRLEVCDITVGQILSNAPSGDDGVWPCAEVRDLLEAPDIRSEEIERGLGVGLYNSRGVVTKNEPGGTMERALAEKYRDMARRTVTKWPRISTVLQRLADSYGHEAKRNDERALAVEFDW